MNLSGKTVCVIGATGGIGREVSAVFAKKGANLLLVARKMDSLTVLEKELAPTKVNISKYTCDLTDPNSNESLAGKIAKDHKNIDVLLHLAGIGVYKNFPEISYEEWKASMDINVTSAFYIFQKLLPLLEKSEKAYVIASGSGMGKVALSGRSAYCTSKFALRGLMQSLSKEYKKTNIHFVHLTLGSVLTSFGPLSLTHKKRKHKEGKGYLEPDWLANHIATKVEHDTLEDETPIYPRHYLSESRKDIR
ncbi:MAG: hypothetical protein US67_C0075G0004 [Candidatus Woesebacteria bacterium GW2011_GWD1_38_10]|uniref:Short-chain dehydrogenase/reductase SDR n=1 Tax=Candidatus Woesebacteria bacterium GW2011_GWD1_38_10 TaxID=1618592 RepID=A0A0G0HU01_9BACT|nr:MAG: hypothetical protein US67_C0075G0004 [Candidatus Woesebacteria bacterium GW2011_GWD1_38_10]